MRNGAAPVTMKKTNIHVEREWTHMKKALVIGGNGKVGGYLCPLLLREGYEAVSYTHLTLPTIA